LPLSYLASPVLIPPFYESLSARYRGGITGCGWATSSTANLGEFPGGYLTDKQVLLIRTERITTVAKRVRRRTEHLSKIDELTSNQLQNLSYQLDKHVWQFRVHMQ